jgi:hypothetical protein
VLLAGAELAEDFACGAAEEWADELSFTRGCTILPLPIEVDGVTLNAGRRRLPEEIDGKVRAGNAS